MSELDDLAQLKMFCDGVEKHLHAFVEEIERGSEAITKNPQMEIPEVTNYIDRWNHLRAQVFRLNWKSTRLFFAAKDNYDDGMRPLLANGVSNKSSYEERHSAYVSRNIEAYRVLRLLERLVEVDLRPFTFYVDRKIRWLEDKRRQLKRDDDDFRYSSSKDYR